jgi:hypothetical protein
MVKLFEKKIPTKQLNANDLAILNSPNKKKECLKTILKEKFIEWSTSSSR